MRARLYLPKAPQRGPGCDHQVGKEAVEPDEGEEEEEEGKEDEGDEEAEEEKVGKACFRQQNILTFRQVCQVWSLVDRAGHLRYFLI